MVLLEKHPAMYPQNGPSTIGVLFSGGLDSSILLAYLLGQGHTIRPFYVCSRLVWEELELAACRQFLGRCVAIGSWTW